MVVGNYIQCPFHGYKIGLGQECPGGFAVPAFKTIEYGGAVFVLLSPECDTGLTKIIDKLRSSHTVTDRLALSVQAPSELIIENAFDGRHFEAVHGINNNVRLRLREIEGRELIVEATFKTSTSRWQSAFVAGGTCETQFVAQVFSPNVCVSELRFDSSKVVVLTSATPDPKSKTSQVWISIAWDSNEICGPDHSTVRRCFVDQSLRAFQQDVSIWETIDLTAKPKFTSDDDLVIKYRDWCSRFVK